MSKGSQREPKRYSTYVLVLSLLTAGFAVVHILLRGYYPPGHPIRLGITGLLVVTFASFIYFFARSISTLDEYARQIHLFALAIAFPLSLALAWAIGYFSAEGMLEGRDPRDLPLVLLIPYGIGYALSWFKYR